MSAMNKVEFSSMIEETSVNTILCEYSIKRNNSIKLVAASLTDIIEDGLSMVYSFYEPELRDLSLGKYMILDHVNLAKEMSLPYLYLGYWVAGSEKMAYKAQYEPLELFSNGKWSLHERSNQTKLRDNRTLSNDKEVTNTIYLPTSNL